MWFALSILALLMLSGRRTAEKKAAIGVDSMAMAWLQQAVALPHDSFEAYKNSNSPTINHFYEKLLLLKDRMFTTTGKAIAQQRHIYMEQYLAEFLNEWEGKA